MTHLYLFLQEKLSSILNLNSCLYYLFFLVKCEEFTKNSLKKTRSTIINQQISDLINDKIDLSDENELESEEFMDKFLTKFTKNYNDASRNLKKNIYFERVDSFTLQNLMIDFRREKEHTQGFIRKILHYLLFFYKYATIISISI